MRFYEMTQEMTEAAGLPAYEISNHAAPGEECRHNLLYWRYGEYVGDRPRRTRPRGGRQAAPRHRDGAAARTLARLVETEGHGIVESTTLEPRAAGRRGAADGAPAHRGPRPRPPGRAQRLQCPSARAIDELAAHGLSSGARRGRCGPRATAASSSTRWCCACPRRWSRSDTVEPDGSGQLKLRLRASPRGSEEPSRPAAPSRGAARRIETPTPNFCTSRMASERSVLPSGSRRKAPSTPVKPLARVSCGRRR